MMNRKIPASTAVKTLAFAAILGAFALFSAATARQSGKEEIFAQRLVEQALARHPEVTGIEMSARSSKGCSTIASTDPKDLAEKCDKDELEPLRTGKPFVEHEADGFDVTLPMRDARGRIIAVVGMDFKLVANQTESQVVEQGRRIVKEIEAHSPVKASLFERVK
jgi:hypothetical protein